MSLRLQTSKENVFSTSLAGTESPSSLRYCCHLCPSVLHNEFFFRLHLGTHEGFTCTSVISSASDVLLCTICGYIASDRNDYVQHIFRHPMERPFACSQCDVDAHRKRDLLTHIRTSHKEHPHVRLIDRKKERAVLKSRPKIVELHPSLCIDNILSKHTYSLTKLLWDNNVTILNLLDINASHIDFDEEFFIKKYV